MSGLSESAYHQSSLIDESDILKSTTPRASELSQYFTPRWAAELLLPMLGPLSAECHVLDPHAGRGSWLHAVPLDIPATGVEIDPAIAAEAHQDTGRPIIIGDFARVEIPFNPSHVVGNPPYTASAIATTLRRCRELLTPGGRAGFILPAHSFSFAARTLELLRGFETEQFVLPRDLYPRLSFALIWLQLTCSTAPRLQGFLLFEEAAAIRSMRTQFRRILESGRRPLWREVTEMGLRACGGQASLTRLYGVIENFRPTENAFWRDAIRREAAEHFERVEPGVFRLPRAA